MSDKWEWNEVTDDPDKPIPQHGKNYLVSFSNINIVAVGEYEQTPDGGGRFLDVVQRRSFIMHGLYVNAWAELPAPYRLEDEEE